MSMLASLVKAYDRIPGISPIGFSAEKIGFAISLNEDGSVAGAPHDLRDIKGKKKVPRVMQVPRPPKRTSGIDPSFLWDKTSYVLGVTAGEGKRTADEHAAFVKQNMEALADADDQGLHALYLFLGTWKPEQFSELSWPEDMKDQNVVFALESERLKHRYLHDRPAARTLWERVSETEERNNAACLVTGTHGPIAQLHPAIKGVWGAQSSGASIVSFNLDAFTSYGHEQGDNAPVSELAAFKYTTVLNLFLAGQSNRIQIGDTSTVFWADASDLMDEYAEKIANSLFLSMAGENNLLADTEAEEAKKVGIILDRIRKGVNWPEAVKDISPHLAEGVRFNVLGLAPNAARLSVRFWLQDDLGKIAENYQRFVKDMAIEPPALQPYPPLWRYLIEVAVLGKRDNVPPNLAGDWLRSILTGTRYPMTLLTSVLLRIRSDKEINALRCSMLRALLVRNFHMCPDKEKPADKTKEAPVALDPDNRNKGYLLGRLFAAYEQIQAAALGRNVNATIRDKFYGSASVQPRKVFHLLSSGSMNHLSKLGKQKPGLKVNLEKAVEGILELMKPGNDPFPASLAVEDQALFALGYYHQRNALFAKPDTNSAQQETEE